ncbi:MAG: uroporphyrinogen-III C-methyltransferase [Planctomycetota bacterium]
MRHRGTNPGTVYLVGAGPGDPGLITLRGVECLRQADLVLYDYLVDPAVLDHAPPTAEVVCLGSHPRQRMAPQEEINQRMIEAARQGKTVVRLKGGDPHVFGRAAEETEALRAAGVAFQAVPGVTAALAAAGYVGIPITHADHASALALVTGQEREGKAGAPLDYGMLADFPGTLILYMGVTNARLWSEALLARGKSPKTPVAIVRRCSWSDQETHYTTLGDAARVIAERGLRPPAVIVVGEVVSLASEASWFTTRPLFGIRVMITRPRRQAGVLWDRLSELGAQVDVQPAIRISGPDDWGPVDAALGQLDRYDWLVFSSVNGVNYLLDRLLEGKGDLRRLGGLKLAAIGSATAEELARYRLRADVVPEQYRAESLAAALVAEAPGRNFLLARASRGRDLLAREIKAAGGSVDQVVVYSSEDVDEADPDVAAALSAGRIDWITVTSSAIADSLVRLFGDDLGRAKLASISPITSETLRKAGHEPAVEAAEYTMEGLVDVMVGFREDKASK